MKKTIAMLLTLVITLSLVACGQTTTEDTAEAPKETKETETQDATGKVDESVNWVWPSIEELHVGFSQADLASTWRTVESDHMEQIADERGYKISITNAEGDTEQQISDVESLLAQGCNAMVIVAIDADAIQPALDICKEKGVPVIMKARGSNGTPGVDYVTSIMSDFVFEGQQAAEWVKKICAEKGIETIKVAEIQGVIGGTDVRDRSQGFHDVADKAGNFEFVAQQSANWSRAEAQEVVQNVLQSTGNDVDVIFCHNDEMALGASLAVQSAGLKINEDIFIIGIDGMVESFEAIKAGTQSVSVTCSPKYADLVFDTIEKAIKGEEIPTSIAVPDVVVDKTNVEERYDLSF